MTTSDPGFIYRFDAADVPGLPTLLLLHGTGGDENDLIPLGRTLLSGGALLSPRGNVREHGMPRFFRRLAEGVFDLEDLRRQTDALANFITKSAEIYAFDAAGVIAVGYSNGANIAANLLLTHPKVLAGAILFHAQVPTEPSVVPDLRGVPVFLSGGRADSMIPVRQTQRLGELLEVAHADVTLHWEPGGHALARGEVTAAQAWLAAVVARKGA